MRIFDVLDVREREGKSPSFASVGTVFVNEETGKKSLYLPMTGRFYPIKEQEARAVAPTETARDVGDDVPF